MAGVSGAHLVLKPVVSGSLELDLVLVQPTTGTGLVGGHRPWDHGMYIDVYCSIWWTC